MKLYPDHAATKLGFDRITQQLAEHCLTVEGRNLALNLTTIHDPVAIRAAMLQVHEMRKLLTTDDALPLGTLPHVSPLFGRIAVNGAFLNEDEAFSILNWLRAVRLLHKYFENRKDKYPALNKLLELSSFDTSFIREIERVLTTDGRLRQDASPLLAKLRSTLTQRSGELRSMMERQLQQARKAGYTDARELTIRNERFVIPVEAGFKGRVQGFVHDVSGSGQTVYIEPAEALNLNNEVRELKIKERNEVIRILVELTDKMRPFLPDWKRSLRFVTEVDFLRARAKLALDMKGHAPRLAAGIIDLKEARHPLLVLQKGRDKVIPLNLELNSEQRVVVISGPNAGGKSVALQTLGLVQLMVQSGLLPPLGEGSVLPVFRKLFVDMGDEQSIQNDLSTYTSHLTHMQAMLQGLDSASLFLIDEFGTGTDPQLGGPMAEALLEAFLSRKAFGCITTHFSNLKEFAETNPATTNAAMEFDSNSLAPTYRFRQGLPGSSFTFEIAARVGIPADVLTAARSKTATERIEAEGLLARLRQRQDELQARQTEIDQLREELAQKTQSLSTLMDKNREMRRNLEENRKKILRQAQEASRIMLQEANARIEDVIRKIKEEKAEKSATVALRRSLEAEQKVAEQKLLTTEALPAGTLPDLPPEELPLDFEDRPLEGIAVGDAVRLRATEALGRVIELQGKRAVVALGELRSSIPLRELVKVAPKDAKRFSRGYAGQALDKSAQMSRQLDVRGLRAEQALELLTPYMDDAIMAGLPESRILHGKGTGALRTAIREFIRRNYPQVKALRDADLRDGGSGVTLVTF